MAAQTATRAPAQLGDAIVAFALEGHFPDEAVSSLALPSADLSSAIEALAKAKSQLEAEVHTINEETKGDVTSWVTNAKTLQEDILRSKRLADDIVRQSEAPDVSGKAIQDAEGHVSFLEREVAYTDQLHEALRGIRHVNELLSEVEQAMNERRILDALRWLEKSWTELDKVPVSKKSCRVMRLLDVRAFELKSAVHDVFDHVWNALVHVNCEAGKVSIYDQREDEPMTLREAVIGLEAYKEVDDRMAQLWQDIDRTIVSPRMDAEAATRPSVQASENMLQIQGDAGDSIDDLFADLQTIVQFLAKRLPQELLIYLSPIMMNDVVPRLVSVWLDAAVPSTLQDIGQFQAVIRSAEAFCNSLEQCGFSGFTELKEWVGNAPLIWLAKCRETALDAVRRQLSQGLGTPRQVEKVEKQMISRSEGKELTANANAVATQANVDDDWGAAWGADDDDQPQDQGYEQQPEKRDITRPGAAKTDAADDDGADAWGWDDDAQGANDGGDKSDKQGDDHDDDDSAAAWGWGDEDTAAGSGPQTSPEAKKTRQPTAPGAEEESREMVLKETYHISSMPEPVLELIAGILEDGAALTQASNETNPVASAAAGLFSLPTFALAMFRAVSPYYYALDMGGNMFLYNDAMYMAEKLGEVAEGWKTREGLTPRARSMLRIDNDIKGLQGFANRAYTDELGVQKTVIRDLLGGEQSLMHQDDVESSVEAAVVRVRSMAVTWEPILARSVWYQAVGSLADALAGKIIADVMDMPSVGQDEAYKIAQLIATVTELDDLFLPSRGAAGGEPQQPAEDEVPATAQYAGSWLRLKYLSEVLQSNLNEVRYLWCESELSLYFSVEEVVDLIEASFEANARTKETIREIRDRPRPVDEV